MGVLLNGNVIKRNYLKKRIFFFFKFSTQDIGILELFPSLLVWKFCPCASQLKNTVNKNIPFTPPSDLEINSWLAQQARKKLIAATTESLFLISFHFIVVSEQKGGLLSTGHSYLISTQKCVRCNTNCC